MGNALTLLALAGRRPASRRHQPDLGGPGLDSGAFGGAASLTVSQALGYAAGQSNVGGSTWYGNVKASQVMAVDVFQAISSQEASSPATA